MARRKTTGSNNRKKKNNLSGFNTPLQPQGQRIVSQAMKNGIIVRFDALEYPIWLDPYAFAADFLPKQKQGGKNIDMDMFMRDNNRTKKPSKRAIQKEMKKTIQNMTLNYYMLAYPNASIKNQKGQDVFMHTDATGAGRFYGIWKKAFEEQMSKYKTTEEKDAALAKAYAQAALDLAPYDANMTKALKKGDRLKHFKALAKLDLTKISKQVGKKKQTSTKKKTGKQQTKKQGPDTTPLSDTKIRSLAKEYNKGGARGKYSKYKALYGVRNATKIKKQAQIYRDNKK